jgi:hypothetical protein
MTMLWPCFFIIHKYLIKISIFLRTRLQGAPVKTRIMLIQDSERPNASTDSNNTSYESPNIQLFGDGKDEGVKFLWRLHAHSL